MNTEITTSHEWAFTQLGMLIEEINQRNSDLNVTDVVSITKHHGIVSSLSFFKNKVFSDDLTRYKTIKNGQFAYSPIHLNEGAIGYLQHLDKAILSPLYHVFEIDEKKVDPYFLYNLLKTDRMIALYRSLTPGGVHRRAAIRFKEFAKIKIPLPSLREQKAIARVLHAIQEAKEKTEEVIRATKEFKKSAMKYLFTYGSLPLGEAERRQLKETEIGMMPEEWEVVRLGDVIKEDIKNGAFIRREKFGHGTLFLNVANTYKSIRIRPGTLERVDCTKEDIGLYGLRIGDLVYVRSSLKREGVGQCCLVGELGEQSIFDCHLMRVRVQEEKVLPPFVAYFSVSPMGKQSLIARSKTTTMTTINQEGLAGFLLPLPNVSTQHQITEILFTIDAKIEAEENKKNALEGLFKTLLHDLMTAKLRVNHLPLEA